MLAQPEIECLFWLSILELFVSLIVGFVADLSLIFLLIAARAAIVIYKNTSVADATGLPAVLFASVEGTVRLTVKTPESSFWVN